MLRYNESFWNWKGWRFFAWGTGIILTVAIVAVLWFYETKAYDFNQPLPKIKVEIER